MKKPLFTLIGVTLLFGSCIDKLEWKGDDPIAANTLRSTIEVEGLSAKMAVTRANINAQAGEDEITSLFLLFFDGEADRSGEFVDYVEIENPTGRGNVHDIDMSDTQLEVTDPYHILAIANIKGTSGKVYLGDMEVAAWMLQWAGKTEQDVMNQARAWTHTGMKIEPNALLMSGRVEKARNQFEVTIPLVRNQARFDILANDIREEYELVSVEIRNAYPSSRIWNASTDEEFAPDYSDNVGRIPYYYGLNSSELTSIFDANNNGLIDKGEEGIVQGHLYVFENQVTMPAQNDKFTTCMVIGLKKYADSSISYYRANISPDESAQMLKRNNTYRLTINSVSGDGENTSDKAYNNPSSELDYTINTWSVPGSGVMVQDDSSLLSSPYKTVSLPRENAQTSFQIFTFTNKPVVDKPLEIMEQSYSISGSDAPYHGITASLNPNSNILSIVGLNIDPGKTVKGSIKLGYMGLRATINVVQTDLTTDFLEVHLPDGGIPRFAPFGGIQSGLLRVEASDEEWTAEIFAPDGGFSFSGTEGKTILKPTDGALITDGNKFRIWTNSPNSMETIREAFIVVSLDKDAENYAQVIRIAQDVAADIAIVPNRAITFDGMGALAAIPNNEGNKFIVRPSQTGEPALFAQWAYRLEPTSANNLFDIVQVDTPSTADPDGNYITITAKGKNTSGSAYNAKLYVYLTDDPAAQASIDIVQRSEGIELSPNTVPAVPKTGGESQPIAIRADGTLKWEVLSFTTSGTGGKFALKNHEAELLLENGDPVVNGAEYSVANDKFKVMFPKIYYPNRETNISATVEVGIVNSTLKKSVTVYQTPLTPAPMVGYGMSGTPDYGGMGDTYNRGWDGTGASHGGVGLAQIPGYKRLGVGNMNVAAINATVNYLHTAPQISGRANQESYTWSVINNFIETRDAWTVISSQDDNAKVPLNKPNSPLKKNVTYPDVSYSRNAYDARVDQRHSGTKIFQFLFAHGHTELSPVIPGDGFHTDGVNTDIDFGSAPWPESGVVLLTKGQSESNPANTNYVMMFIDIEHRFLWMGESQMFWYDYHLRGGRGVFLDNLMYFIANASKYGSHFTDLLLEDGVDLGDGRKAQRALWDEAYWGRDVTREMTK